MKTPLVWLVVASSQQPTGLLTTQDKQLKTKRASGLWTVNGYKLGTERPFAANQSEL